MKKPTNHFALNTKHFLSGQTLLIGVIFMTVILIISATLFSRVASYLRFGSNNDMRKQAEALADAGVDYAIWKLNTLAGSCGTGGTTWCNIETAVGTTGSFEASVATKSSTLKTLSVTSYVPNKANARSKRTVKTDVGISDTLIAFNYGVQVGTGGLSLGQSAQINGSVYSNKEGVSISGNNSSTITGDAFAVGTIPNPPIVNGLRRENQQPSEMPPVNYQQWKDAAASVGTVDCSTDPSLCNLTGAGTAILAGKYIGNVSLAQSKAATMTGPVYITGNLDLGQSSHIDLASSFGSNSEVLILDGTVSVGQTANINPTNASPKGYIMLVTTSTNSSAFDFGQSGINAIVYALEGGVILGQSAHATAIIAKTLTLDQSAVLTYDQGLASTDFSSGPGGAWVPKKGTYRFTL